VASKAQIVIKGKARSGSTAQPVYNSGE
jgi:hypothetical protein